MSFVKAFGLTCLLSSGPIAAGPVLAAPEIAPAQSTTVILSAQGEITAVPDMATLSFGVVTEGSTAEEAMRLNREQMTAALGALKKTGIADKNIMTSGLNLAPRYTTANATSISTIRSYQASNQISVRIEDLAKVGPSLDAVVKTGVNQVRGIRFGLKDADQSEDSARKMAVKVLTERANLYAQSLGMKVRAIRTLSEGTNYPAPIAAYVPGIAVSGSRPVTTPVSEGELSVSITVTAQFELE
jgi:uncharacterized protein